MKRLLAGLTLLALLASGCGVGKDAVNQNAGVENRFVAGSGVVQYPAADRLAAPPIRGTAVSGPAIDTAAYRGKVLVVNWWGSWCAPCRTEAPALEEVYAISKNRGVQFVGVNIKDAKDRAAAFERAYGLTYPSVFDDAGRVAQDFRKTPPVGQPATILVDKQGRVATIFRRAVLYGELKDAVDELVAERA